MKKFTRLSLLIVGAGVSSLAADEYSPEFKARIENTLKKEADRLGDLTCSKFLELALACGIEEVSGHSIFRSYRLCLANGKVDLPQQDYTQTFPVSSSTILVRLDSSNTYIDPTSLNNEIASEQKTLANFKQQPQNIEQNGIVVNNDLLQETEKRIAILTKIAEKAHN